VLDDRLLRIDKVLGRQRVRLVVGERAVELQEQPDDLDVQRTQHAGDGVPGHAVSGVHDHLEPADAVQVDQGAQVRTVLTQDVLAAEGSGLCDCIGKALRVVRHRERPELDEEVAGHRLRADAAELRAVVAGGVVRGSELYARQSEVPRGEPQTVG